MTRKIKVPSEDAIAEGEVPQEPSEQNDISEDWPELQRVLREAGEPIETFYEKGWKLFLRKKPSGKQYIALRLQGKDPETGEKVDTERSLGPLADYPEKYEALLDMFPGNIPTIVPKSEYPRITHTDRSSVLTTKVARLNPIGPSVEIRLGTLQWYNWLQAKGEYTGMLDDFINGAVEDLFTEYYGLEIGVVHPKEEN